MMRSNKRHYIPERDKNVIREKILNAVKRNNKASEMQFPDAMCGDQLSVLQQCASVGIQKWPITRKWAVDEDLLKKGHRELEFHSRCNFNPVEPECQHRNYLIGPNQFVEHDQEKYMTAFFGDSSEEHAPLMSRRLTAVGSKFQKIPQGYSQQPVLLEKTWDVVFIPRDCEDTGRKTPQCVEVENATRETMMEIYKHSNGFFITKINEPKYVKMTNKQPSKLTKKELFRQSILRISEKDNKAEIDSDKMKSPLHFMDFTETSDRIPTEQQGRWFAPAPPRHLVVKESPQQRELSSKLPPQLRAPSPKSQMGEVIEDVKPPTEQNVTKPTPLHPLQPISKVSKGIDGDSFPSEITALPQGWQTSEEPSKIPFSPETGIKPKLMKEYFSKGVAKKSLVSPPLRPESKEQLPKALRHLVVAEDVKHHIDEKKMKQILMKERPSKTFSNKTDMMEAVQLRISSGKKDEQREKVKAEKEKEEKKKMRFDRVKKSSTQDQVYTYPSFEMPEKSKQKEENILQEAIKKQIAEKKQARIVRTDSNPKKSPRAPKPKVVQIDKAPEMGTEDREDFRRSVTHSEVPEAERSTVSSAWSRKRTLKKLESKRIAEQQRDEKKTLLSEIKGQVKSLHDASADGPPGLTLSTEKSTSRPTSAEPLTGIPEFDIPSGNMVEPLDLQQFTTDPPSFEERSQLLTQTVKKGKQRKLKSSKNDASSNDESGVTFDEEIVSSRMDYGTDQRKARDRQSLLNAAKRLSKLELYKHAKDRGEEDKKEEFMHDLVDVDKPLKSISESVEAKSPFQLGTDKSDKHGLSDDDSKRRSKTGHKSKTGSSPSQSKAGSSLSGATTDGETEDVQRVGDLDLLETTTTKRSSKKAWGRKPSKMRFFRDTTTVYKGSRKSSLRTKYGLYHTAHLLGNKERTDIPQEEPDEPMFTFGRYPTTSWSAGHEMGAQPRFHYPMQLSILDGLSPMEYLDTYTTIPPRRLGVYQRIFKKHAIRKEIPMSIMKQALEDMVVGAFSKGDYMSIMSLVERNKAKAIPWEDFKLICCLTDRLMDDVESSTAVTPMTDFLQGADSQTMLHMLKDQTSNIPLTNLLNAVASCQLND